MSTPEYYKGNDGHDVYWLVRNWRIEGFERNNAIKYIIRAGHKDSERDDIAKAIDCLEKDLARLDARKGEGGDG